MELGAGALGAAALPEADGRAIGDELPPAFPFAEKALDGNGGAFVVNGRLGMAARHRRLHDAEVMWASIDGDAGDGEKVRFNAEVVELVVADECRVKLRGAKGLIH